MALASHTEAGTEEHRGLPASDLADPACRLVDLAFLRAGPVEGTALRTSRRKVAAGIAGTVAADFDTTVIATATAAFAVATTSTSVVAELVPTSATPPEPSSALPAIVSVLPTAAMPSAGPLARPSSEPLPVLFSGLPPMLSAGLSIGLLVEPSTKLPTKLFELPRLCAELLAGPAIAVATAIVVVAIGLELELATKLAVALELELVVVVELTIGPATMPAAMLATELVAAPIVVPVARLATEPTSAPVAEPSMPPQRQHQAAPGCLRRWAGWEAEPHSPCQIHSPECLEVVVVEPASQVAVAEAPVLLGQPVAGLLAEGLGLQPECQVEEVEELHLVEAGHSRQVAARNQATRHNLVAVRPCLATRQAGLRSWAGLPSQAGHIQADLHNLVAIHHSPAVVAHPCQAVLWAVHPWRAGLLEASPGRRPGQSPT